MYWNTAMSQSSGHWSSLLLKSDPPTCSGCRHYNQGLAEHKGETRRFSRRPGLSHGCVGWVKPRLVKVIIWCPLHDVFSDGGLHKCVCLSSSYWFCNSIALSCRYIPFHVKWHKNVTSWWLQSYQRLPFIHCKTRSLVSILTWPSTHDHAM